MSVCVRQSDLFNIHSIKRYWKDVENEHKWSWKVLENAREKVLESHGRSISLFSMHPVFLILNSTSSFCYHKLKKAKANVL